MIATLALIALTAAYAVHRLYRDLRDTSAMFDFCDSEAAPPAAEGPGRGASPAPEART